MTDSEDLREDGSISSLLHESLASSQNVDSVSTEDIAWADSCLVKDLEISDGEWSSVKDSLLEMLSLIPDSSAVATTTTTDRALPAEGGTDLAGGGTDVEMLSSPDEPAVDEEQEQLSGDSRGSGPYPVTIGGESEGSSIDLSILSKEEMDALSSISYLVQDPETFDGDWNSMREAVERILSLRPSSRAPQTNDLLKERNTFRLLDNGGTTQSSAFDETTMNGNAFEPGMEDVNNHRVLKDGHLPADTNSSSTQEAEQQQQQPATSEIFKIWDLCIPDEEEEEDEFIKQLNKALSGSSVQSSTGNNDSAAWKDIKEGALDHLINGIGDLSIQHDSS
ncbi:hypothetical protein LINPERHAP2_LOCUS30593 [Linum perenne]